MLGLRQQAENRILSAALVRIGDILAIIGSWSPSRQDAARRLLSDSLSRRLLEIEGGRKTLAQVTAEIQARVGERDPAPVRDPGAAFADELLLHFLMAMKFSREERLRNACETIFQTIHRFTSR